MESKEKKFNNPIDKDKITENPGTLPYPHTIGSVVIKPEDMGKVKSNALSAMFKQTDSQLNQIKEQIELLAKQAKRIEERKEISIIIYSAQMGFDPLIGHTYHLYKKSSDFILSMVSPGEWGKQMPYDKFVASVKLLSDHTWEILEK